MTTEHISRSRLKQIIDERQPMREAEHYHLRGCAECREQLVVMFSQYEDRQPRRKAPQYVAPLAILVVILVVSLVFLAVMLETW